MEPQTGLVILYRLRLARTGVAPAKDQPNMGGRHKWMAVEFQLGPAPNQAFWVVVNHGASDHRRKLEYAEALREASAREIGEFFLKRVITPSAEAIVLLGDFNCEPFSRPFVGKPTTDRMVAVRERAVVLRDGNKLMYTYNPMWRLLGEPDDHEVAISPHSGPTRPIGTFVTNKEERSGWRTWDQILVSKRVLLFGPLRLQEASIRFEAPVNSCSDHHAVSAVFV